MNDDDRTIISDTTSEDSRTYMHSFPRVQMMERPPVIIECTSTVPKLKGILHNKQDISVDTSLINDTWCNDRPVKKIRIVVVIDTVNKPIYTTQLQWDTAWETFLNIPGYILKHQGYLYNRHLHWKRIVHVECDTELQWNLNCTQLQTVHRLLRGRPLRDHPEKLYVDELTRAYNDSIDKSEPLAKGKHVYREG
jgi:hypothetical protein